MASKTMQVTWLGDEDPREPLRRDLLHTMNLVVLVPLLIKLALRMSLRAWSWTVFLSGFAAAAFIDELAMILLGIGGTMLAWDFDARTRKRMRRRHK